MLTIRLGVKGLIGFSDICLKNNLKAQEWLGPFEYFKLFSRHIGQSPISSSALK